MVADHTVLIHSDAAALLPTMLQRVQAIVGVGHHIHVLVAAVHGEHAAFIVDLAFQIIEHRPLTFS